MAKSKKTKPAMSSATRTDPLVGNVQSAPTGWQGFDANTVISSNTAAAFRQQGFRFCLRYISRTTPQGKGNLTRTEAQEILDAGLALMPVQHVSAPDWVPTQALGDKYGRAAAANARTVGFPDAVTVWLDLEGIRKGTPSAEVIAYCNAWFSAVGGAGYDTGVYVGANCRLTGDELFWRLKTTHYWRSGSHVPEIPHRGYQLIQRITPDPDLVNGIEIDRDLCEVDDLGGAAVWLAPAGG